MGDFSILTAAIEVTGLEPDLDNCRFGPVTVFAPQNKNFLDLIRELGITAEELLESKELKTILLNHAVAGEVFAGDLSDGLCVESLAGFELCFEINRPTRPPSRPPSRRPSRPPTRPCVAAVFRGCNDIS